MSIIIAINDQFLLLLIIKNPLFFNLKKFKVLGLNNRGPSDFLL